MGILCKWTSYQLPVSVRSIPPSRNKHWKRIILLKSLRCLSFANDKWQQPEPYMKCISTPGCKNCSMLPSQMGKHGVSLENMEKKTSKGEKQAYFCWCLNKGIVCWRETKNSLFPPDTIFPEFIPTVGKIITYALGEHDPGSAQVWRTSNDFCSPDQNSDKTNMQVILNSEISQVNSSLALAKLQIQQ